MRVTKDYTRESWTLQEIRLLKERNENGMSPNMLPPSLQHDVVFVRAYQRSDKEAMAKCIEALATVINSLGESPDDFLFSQLKGRWRMMQHYASYE